MALDDFKKILSKIPKKSMRRGVALHWRGESCLHPQLPEIASICRKNGINSWISTNTSTPLLNNVKYVSNLLSSLYRIEACVDGYDQETLSRYRVGANWKMLLKNIETIGSTDTDCLKDMRVLMFKYNEGHEYFFRALARKNGFNRVGFACPIINYRVEMSDAEATTWLSTKKKYQRYAKKGDMWVLKRRGACMPHLCISVHGTAHPCGHDWNLNYKLGNLLEDDWSTININFNEIKPRMMKKSFPMCSKWCCLPKDRVTIWENL